MAIGSGITMFIGGFCLCMKVLASKEHFLAKCGCCKVEFEEEDNNNINNDEKKE